MRAVTLCLTNRFHVAVRLLSNILQMTSKCGKNKKKNDARGDSRVCNCVFPYFNVFCDFDILMSSYHILTPSVICYYFSFLFNASTTLFCTLSFSQSRKILSKLLKPSATLKHRGKSIVRLSYNRSKARAKRRE